MEQNLLVVQRDPHLTINHAAIAAVIVVVVVTMAVVVVVAVTRVMVIVTRGVVAVIKAVVVGATIKWATVMMLQMEVHLLNTLVGHLAEQIMDSSRNSNSKKENSM